MCDRLFVATLSERMAEVISSKRVNSYREWAKRAGRSETWLNTLRSRESGGAAPPKTKGGKPRGAKGIKAVDALALARAAQVSVEWLLGGEPPPDDELWTDFKAWASSDPAIAGVVDAHPRELKVGDLLRYRAAPSSEGQRDSVAIWETMLRLRTGGIDPAHGRAVTVEDEERALGRATRRRR